MMSTKSQVKQQQDDSEELRRRLEKLSRHYHVDTMKMFMVVEALGEDALHAVYSGQRRAKWQSVLQRQEACRLDLARHEKTRDRYRHFLNEVSREEQGRQWFLAVLQTLHHLGAADTFSYINTHTNKHNGNARSPRRLDPHRHQLYTPRQRDADHRHINHHHHNQHHNLHHTVPNIKDMSSFQEPGALGSNGFCSHLIKLFEKKLETWFDSFQAVAVKLTAHVKVSGLVRVLSGQVHALCMRQGRLHAVAVKVTAQDTPRPLDVAELCLAKVMVIQNGLALPEDLTLALLILHVHPARPVLRLWHLRPSVEMETAIRLADIDDMIDAGRLSQYHELWADNTTTELTATNDADSVNTER